MVPHAKNDFVELLASGTTFKRRLFCQQLGAILHFQRSWVHQFAAELYSFRKTIVGAVLVVLSCDHLVLKSPRFTDCPRNHQGRTPEDLAKQSEHPEVKCPAPNACDSNLASWLQIPTPPPCRNDFPGQILENLQSGDHGIVFVRQVPVS